MSRSSARHEAPMRRCLELARRVLASGDAPVGALLMRGDKILAEGIESVRALCDVSAHAEIEALRVATVGLDTTDLSGTTLYTTVAPCTMCAYAIRLARVGTVVTGAPEPGGGGPLSGRRVLTDPEAVANRPVPRLVEGVLASECEALLARRATATPKSSRFSDS